MLSHNNVFSNTLLCSSKRSRAVLMHIKGKSLLSLHFALQAAHKVANDRHVSERQCEMPECPHQQASKEDPPQHNGQRRKRYQENVRAKLDH